METNKEQFQTTPAASVADTVASLRRFYNTQITQRYEWRLTQLQKFKAMLKSGSEELSRAMYLDLHRSKFESHMLELNLVDHEIQVAIDNLKLWMTDKKVSTNLLNLPGHSSIKYDSLGVVLIMAPWNYPVQLLLSPLVGALAAGNTALLRPASYSRHTSAALSKLISKHFDPSVVAIVTGERDVTEAVLAQRFDMIFFTGGPALGRIVHASANKHLTPVVLELGGKSPAIVDTDVDLDVTARRLVWGSMLNLGQTCVRVDHVFVHESVADKLLTKMRDCIKQFYAAGCTDADEYAIKDHPDHLCPSIAYAEDPSKHCDVTKSPYLGRIINNAAFKRLTGILETDKSFLYHGGASIAEQSFIEPSILYFGKDMKAFDASASMQDEIFGPILPVVAVSSVVQAIARIRAHDKPLALYCFTSNQRTQDLVATQTSSGSLVFNDVVVHLSNHNLPFGGVGMSGMGSYHGFYSFKCFSHEKSIMSKYGHSLLDISARYPPYHKKKQSFLNFVGAPFSKPLLRRLWFFVSTISAVVGFVVFQKYVLPILINFLKALQS